MNKFRPQINLQFKLAADALIFFYQKYLTVQKQFAIPQYAIESDFYWHTSLKKGNFKRI